MKEKKLSFSYDVYAQIEELSREDQVLLKTAIANFHNAYAPYSGFYVSAAVMLENGEVITGTNQENVAYPSGMCAERVAVFYAESKYPDIPVRTIAIYVKARDFTVINPVTPCGACRQVLAEYESKQSSGIRLILKGEQGNIMVINKAGDLLPLKFDADDLKKP